MPRQDDVGLALTYYQSCWAQPIREAIKKVNLDYWLGSARSTPDELTRGKQQKIRLLLGTSIGILGQASSLANHVLFALLGSTMVQHTAQQHGNNGTSTTMTWFRKSMPASARFMIVGRRQQAVLRVASKCKWSPGKPSGGSFQEVVI